MPEYDNKGRFTLFRNKNRASDKHPEYTGTLTLIDGTECFLDAWINESKKTGEKYFSGKYKPKDAQAHAGNDDNGEQSQSEDVPF